MEIPMSDWIKKQADGIKQHESAEAKRREWEIHKHGLIQQNWAVVWRTVLHAMDEDVRVFNAQFQDSGRHITFQQTDTSAMLQRNGDQVAHVLQVSASPNGIAGHVIVTRYQPGSQGQDKSDVSLSFNANSEGVVGVANGGILTPQQVSERLLRHLF